MCIYNKNNLFFLKLIFLDQLFSYDMNKNINYKEIKSVYIKLYK